MGSGSYSYEVISSVFNEDAFEQGVVDHLCSEHGYEYLYGPDVPRSSDAFDDAFLPDVIGPALEAINTGINRRLYVKPPLTCRRSAWSSRPWRRRIRSA